MQDAVPLPPQGSRLRLPSRVRGRPIALLGELVSPGLRCPRQPWGRRAGSGKAPPGCVLTRRGAGAAAPPGPPETTACGGGAGPVSRDPADRKLARARRQEADSAGGQGGPGLLGGAISAPD